MVGVVEQNAQLVVFLMVNPFLGQPFYVGTKRAGARLNDRGDNADIEMRRHILTSIRDAGRRVQRVAVAGVDDRGRAAAAQAFWVRALLHGGVDVVNHQAPFPVRERALQIHTEACERYARQHQFTLDSHRQGELPLGESTNDAPYFHLTADAPSPRSQRRAWTPEDDAKLCSRFLQGEDLGIISLGLGRTERAILLRLNDLQKSHPELRPRMVRSKLVGGSMGVFRVTRQALANADRPS